MMAQWWPVVTIYLALSVLVSIVLIAPTCGFNNRPVNAPAKVLKARTPIQRVVSALE
jgi:hypothetical protein